MAVRTLTRQANSGPQHAPSEPHSNLQDDALLTAAHFTRQTADLVARLGEAIERANSAERDRDRYLDQAKLVETELRRLQTTSETIRARERDRYERIIDELTASRDRYHSLADRLRGALDAMSGSLKIVLQHFEDDFPKEEKTPEEQPANPVLSQEHLDAVEHEIAELAQEFRAQPDDGKPIPEWLRAPKTDVVPG